jgi:hypothetical protein
MNIYQVDSGLKSYFVHSCTVGTAINRSGFGKEKRTIGIKVTLIRRNVTKEQWKEFREHETK